ncbi:ribosomal-processing cysteine protease Prp [Anaeromicropila populeti]|uniref:Ribosomal processing cysteine protease Prp n=1 Tax=Anaeromicropila populeti TaxID=37658 RepID=A0A1I6L2C3_9FIRM|nr:ribosomal-processing cysteine protease Prp [Anaeromicropila populeti]SFR97614.1 hypothetical protein SAMN05661086_03016 [Anaeromicropila populeti]
MIKVRISRNDAGICKQFSLHGHAGYAENGEDIVCSAVSVLVINTINSIETFTDDDFFVESEEEDGWIGLEMTGTMSKETELLINSMLLGLKAIEEQYGNKFISIIEQ